MKITYKYYKNSNTGDILVSQKFENTITKNIPVFWYDINGNEIGENLTLPDGYIEISEKKYKLIKRKR